MIEVASFVGPSYAGKSTLVEGVAARLAEAGLTADVIKKDEVIHALGRERHGDNDRTGGYSMIDLLRYGPLPSAELHAHMNEAIHLSLSLGHIALLEGGTRTRKAQAETLRDIMLDDDGLRIFLLNLPFRDVIRRARWRRAESGRYDDLLPIAASKLASQYLRDRSPDAPQPTDPDVTVLDARQESTTLIDEVTHMILDSRA